MDFYCFLKGFQKFSSFGWFGEGLGVGSGIWFPQHGKCSHEYEKTIVLSLQPLRSHNNEMLILSFSWLHFSCGHHFLGHAVWPGGMREAIRRPTGDERARLTRQVAANSASSNSNQKLLAPEASEPLSFSLPSRPRIPQGGPQEVHLIVFVSTFFRFCWLPKRCSKFASKNH